MVLTAQQVDAFKVQSTRAFARRLADYFGGEFGGSLAHSGEAIPRGAALEARVLELVEVAGSFGVETELAAGQFVALGLGYSRDFHQVARVAEMLTSTDHSPEENVQRVLNAVIVAEARVA